MGFAQLMLALICTRPTHCYCCGTALDLIDEPELTTRVRGQHQRVRQVGRPSEGGGGGGQVVWTRGPAQSAGHPSSKEEMAVRMLRQRVCHYYATHSTLT